MSILQDVIAAGGSSIDQGQGWIISYWHVPGGYDYVNAEARVCFMNDHAQAQAIAARYDVPTELAILISRSDYEKSKAQRLQAELEESYADEEEALFAKGNFGKGYRTN